MKFLLLSLLIILTCKTGISQDTSRNEIRIVIQQLSTEMERGDTTALRTLFNPDAYIQSVNKSRGVVELFKESLNGFITAVGSANKGSLREIITIEKILVDGDLAVVWAPYKFYLNGIYSHCGVDVYQLVRLRNKWVIISIADTRRVKKC